jgi:hypothetical protein
VTLEPEVDPSVAACGARAGVRADLAFKLQGPAIGRRFGTGAGRGRGIAPLAPKLAVRRVFYSQPFGISVRTQRSISRIKHDLHRRNAQSAYSPDSPAKPA